MSNHRKVDIIVDLQYGSTGKGAIAGFLAAESMKAGDPYDLIINANMPNAGHTYIDEFGHKMVHKVLPSGIVGKPNFVFLGAGSVFSIGQLADEISKANSFGYKFKVFVHPNATILAASDVTAEKESINGIGSTQSGAAEATITKIRRQSACTAGQLRPAMEPMEDIGVYVATLPEWEYGLTHAESILAEGAQGYDLGINGAFYPYCTSRDCTPTRFMADMGIPHGYLRSVIGTVRTFPIRVGGNSGGHYSDQKEISWSELGQPPEYTTVTNRMRRVFTFSREQIRRAAWECQPDHIFLNFCNYLKSDKEVNDLVKVIEQEVDKNRSGAVKFLGYGPRHQDIRMVYR